MDKIVICDKCGTKISAKFNAFPGSCTESEDYECPKCNNHLFKSRDSGYYELSVISEKAETNKKEANYSG